MKKLITLALAAIGLAACGLQKPMTEAQYAKTVRKDIPFAVSEFKQVKPRSPELCNPGISVTHETKE